MTKKRKVEEVQRRVQTIARMVESIDFFWDTEVGHELSKKYPFLKSPLEIKHGLDDWAADLGEFIKSQPD